MESSFDVDTPSKKELEIALSAIRRAYPGADVIQEGVAESYAVGRARERLVYLNAVHRGALSQGDDYVTWIVTLFGSEATQVESVRSRACSTGGDR